MKRFELKRKYPNYKDRLISGGKDSIYKYIIPIKKKTPNSRVNFNQE